MKNRALPLAVFAFLLLPALLPAQTEEIQELPLPTAPSFLLSPPASNATMIAPAPNPCHWESPEEREPRRWQPARSTSAHSQGARPRQLSAAALPATPNRRFPGCSRCPAKSQTFPGA